MNAEHFVTATERAEAMAAEYTVHLFLERHGIDPVRFVEDVAGSFGEELALQPPDKRAEYVALQFLRGVVIGILASNAATEEPDDG